MDEYCIVHYHGTYKLRSAYFGFQYLLFFLYFFATVVIIIIVIIVVDMEMHQMFSKRKWARGEKLRDFRETNACIHAHVHFLLRFFFLSVASFRNVSTRTSFRLIFHSHFVLCVENVSVCVYKNWIPRALKTKKYQNVRWIHLQPTELPIASI